jgi:hypothetical protein
MAGRGDCSGGTHVVSLWTTMRQVQGLKASTVHHVQGVLGEGGLI